MDDVYITSSGTPAPVYITVNNDVPAPIVITTSESCKVFSVNGKLGYVVLDKSDIGLGNVENLSLLASSGYLQLQIDSLGESSVQTGQFYDLSGQLIATGSNLEGLIYNLSGYVNTQDSILYSQINNSGILLSNLVSALSGSLNATGSYLLYQTNSLTASGINLQNQINAIYNSGFLTGFNSGDYLLKSQTGDFVSKSETGVFALSSSLYSSGELLYARDSQVSGTLNETGLYLDNKIGNLTDLFTGYTGIVSENRFVNITGDVMSGQLSLPSLSVLDSGFVQFSTGIPSWNEGRVFYDWDTHSVSFYNDQSDMTVNLSQEQLVRVSNGWTGTIPNGMVVLVSGSQGNRPRVIPASCLVGAISDHDVLGMATHDIETVGYITTQGVVNGLNTIAYDEGTLLYLSTSSGAVTNVAPTPPNHTVKVGIVIRQHANQGAVFVKINNGEHLEDLHDVYVTNPQNGDYLTYNTGSGIWFNSALNTGNFASVYSLNQTGTYLENLIDTSSGHLQGQLDNLDNLYATDSQLTGLSGQLYGVIGQTGAALQNQINNLYSSGFITGVDLSPYLTGFNSGDYVLKSETGIFATQSSLTSSGTILSASISSLSGSLNSTGSNLQSQINNITAVSGDFVTRAESGQFYPTNNPSGFLTGVDLTSYVLKSETGIFALSSSLASSGALLYDRDAAISGSLNSTGSYLDNKIDNLSGYAVNNFALQSNLAATGVTLQQQLDNLNIMAIAYAIAL